MEHEQIGIYLKCQYADTSRSIFVTNNYAQARLLQNGAFQISKKKNDNADNIIKAN
jgi:hypothetical protein